jgi:ADP-ribose diphosphatase
MTTNAEKPSGRPVGWTLRASQTRFQNEIFRVREDEVALPDGEQMKYAYVERDEAVVIVPVTGDGKIVMLKQYRYAVDEWCVEVPAGGMHDSGDASPEEVARKELREEIGATAEKLTYIDFFFSANAITDEKCHVFLAQGVELSKQPQTEASETLETRLVPIAEGLELARTGKMKTAPCALAVLLCEAHLRRLA